MLEHLGLKVRCGRDWRVLRRSGRAVVGLGRLGFLSAWWDSARWPGVYSGWDLRVDVCRLLRRRYTLRRSRCGGGATSL